MKKRPTPQKPSLPSLDSLQARIDAASPEKPAEPETSPGGLAQALNAGVELVAGVAVGGALGYGLDRWLGTSPWFLILLFFMGAAAGFLNLIRGAGQGKWLEQTTDERSED